MARSKVICDKQEIIDAAFELLKREGIINFSLRRLAKEMKISPMTVYNYVKNLDEIYKEVILKGFNILYKALFKDLVEQKDNLQKYGIKYACKLMALDLMDFAIENSQIYLLMFSTENNRIRRDPEVMPYYSFYSKISYRMKIDSEKTKDFKKTFYIFELIISSIIIEKIRKINDISMEEYNNLIDFSIDRLFNDKFYGKEGDNHDDN